MPRKRKDEERAPDPRLITRRQMLRYSATAAAGASVLPQLELGQKMARVPYALAANRNPTVSVVRAKDMLVLRFEFFNLKLLRKGQRGPGDDKTNRLVREVPTRPGYVIVHFGPQAIAERAYFHVSDDPAPENEQLAQPPIPAALSGPSRVAFQIPDDMESVPYKLEVLLGWNAWDPSLHPAARANAPQARPDLYEPLFNQTAIEAPWRLIMSPSELSRWTHEREPVTRQGRTHLWHTLLGAYLTGPQGPGEPEADSPETDGAERVAPQPGVTTPTLRAIWTPGFKRYPKPDPNDSQPYPGATSLTRYNRYEIVRLTSDWKNVKYDEKEATFNPRPVRANRFMLSALGAWIDLEGAWPLVDHQSGGVFPTEWNNDLIEWDHRAVMGRDTFVKVVEAGFLFPTRHFAAVITITERKIEAPTTEGAFKGKVGAYLRQRAFIVVREPVKTYGNPQQRYGGRQWPFSEVRLLTLVTPNLDNYDVSKPDSYQGATGVRKNPNAALTTNNVYGKQAFWPMSLGQDVLFSMRARNLENRTVEFSAPLIFIANSLVEDSEAIDNIIEDYAASDLLRNPVRRTRPFSGQKVTYSDMPSTKPDSQAYETEHVVLGGSKPVSGDPGSVKPFYFPIVRGAKVRLQAAEQMKAGSGDPLQSPTVAYKKEYLENGDNPGKVFAFVSDPDKLPESFPYVEEPSRIEFNFEADKSGAVITPYISITGLSAITGPVGGNAVNSLAAIPSAEARAAGAAAGTFNPEDFFTVPTGLDFPKILGGIPLFEILQSVGLEEVEKIPKLLQQRFPDRIEVSYDWETPTKADNFVPELGPIFQPQPGETSVLALRMRVATKLDGGVPGTPEFQIIGELTNFQMNLLGTGDFRVLRIPVDAIRFTVKNGAKPDITVDMPGTEFLGVLAFISKLQKFLQTVGVTGNAPAPLPSGNGAAAAEEGDEGSGLDVNVDETGIRAGFSLEIPSITVGVFSLEGLSFNLSFSIPWIGDPAQLVFSFCTRDRPFQLTVMGFGGGGFVALTLDLQGFEKLEAELFAAAQLALDFGVASGKLEANVGVNFIIEDTDPGPTTTITSFVRLLGEVDVLGLVYLSIELYLAMKFISNGDGSNELWGQASITVEVEVLVFSGSVTIGPYERRFAGSGSGGSAPAPALAASSNGDGKARAATPENNPISFASTTKHPEWVQYAAAFADSSVTPT